MYKCSLQQVIVDFVHVLDRADDRGDNVPLSKRLDLAEDASVSILNKTLLCGNIVIFVGLVGIDPYFCFESASAVVQAVGNVGHLLADVADLADKGDLRSFGAVDFEEVGLASGLVLSIDELFDRYRSECVFAV